ncbi:MAG: hypothetical protein V1808_02955 [Candidatus Daviesbacteria bacterium]
MATEYKNNIENWIKALEVAGATELVEQLSEDNGYKVSALDDVEKAGLPCYPRLTVSMERFLADPNSILKNFEYPLYWTLLLPRTPILQKIGY